MNENGIFGSPPEPHFNLKAYCLSPDLLEESLYILADENEKKIEKYATEETEDGFFKDGKTVGKIFKDKVGRG